MKILILLLNFLFVGATTNQTIVDKAIAIQNKYKVTNNKYVVMVDFSKSIDQERLYIVNIRTGKIEITSIVSHGVNSGKEFATDFSNVIDSWKSSLGAYLTEDTNNGYYGYSLIVKGLDKTNSNAKKERLFFIQQEK